MRLILIEDDHWQSKSLIKKLPKEIPGLDIVLYETEHQFRSMVKSIAKDPPNFFLIDIMLRWTNPSPKMAEAPEEVISEGFYTAGFRCLKEILASKELKNIPTILYTVLDIKDLDDKLNDLPKNVTYISKEKELSYLVESIVSKGK